MPIECERTDYFRHFLRLEANSNRLYGPVTSTVILRIIHQGYRVQVFRQEDDMVFSRIMVTRANLPTLDQLQEVPKIDLGFVILQGRRDFRDEVLQDDLPVALMDANR